MVDPRRVPGSIFRCRFRESIEEKGLCLGLANESTDLAAVMLGKANPVAKKVYYDLRRLLSLCVSVAPRMTAGTGLGSQQRHEGWWRTAIQGTQNVVYLNGLSQRS